MPNGKPVNNSHYKVNTLPLGAIFTKKDSMLKYTVSTKRNTQHENHWKINMILISVALYLNLSVL